MTHQRPVSDEEVAMVRAMDVSSGDQRDSHTSGVTSPRGQGRGGTHLQRPVSTPEALPGSG